MTKNILILGMSKSGKSALKLLYNAKNNFYIYDQNEEILTELVESYIDYKNVFIVKTLDEQLLCDLNLIIISPSISIFDPFILKAKSKKINVFSELELGYKYLKNRLIAVTGTNGKTTTVNLINAMFEASKRPSKMVGNIGVPLCEVVTKLPRRTTLICEVSSFQLEAIVKFKPLQAGILNITPDHINRHGSFEEYFKTKFKLFKNLKKGSKIIVNSSLKYKNKNLNIYEFGFEKLAKGCYVKDQKIYFSNGKKHEIVCHLSDTNLIGNHNLENIMASICFAKFNHIKNKHIIEALHNFKPCSHRIEKVYERAENFFYDDSKATNIDATIRAVQSFKSPYILILGGSDKGYEYDEIFKNLNEYTTEIVACGQVATKIEQAGMRNNIAIKTFKTLQEATIYACNKLEKGQSLLLSPASASFDEFKDYKERGEKFLIYIKNYYEKI